MLIKKIKSLKDIEQLQQQVVDKQKICEARVLICMTGCRARGAQSLAEKFRESLKAAISKINGAYNPRRKGISRQRKTS